MSSTRIRVVVVIVVIAIGAIVLPIIPITQSETIIQIYDQSLQSGYYTWREFAVEDGSKVNIEFRCSGEVNAYLFTLNQFTNFQNIGEEDNINSLKSVESGIIDQTLDSGGIYYFVLFNPGDHSNTIHSTTGISRLDLKVTLLQKILRN